MTLQIWFWLIIAVWLIFGFWRNYIPGQPYNFIGVGGTVIELILFIIIGWRIFGSPVQ